MIGSSVVKRRTCTYDLCPVKKVLMSCTTRFAVEICDSSAAKLNSIIYSVARHFAEKITFRTAESHFFPSRHPYI